MDWGMIEPAHYIGQELICLFEYPNDLGPNRGEVVKLVSFGYVEAVKTIMLEFDGHVPSYQAKYFIDRKDFNSQMLALPKGHIPRQLIPLPKDYKLN